jgi:putative flippase GtrA
MPRTNDRSSPLPRTERLATLVRSVLAGGAATLSDLLTLAVLLACGVPARVASLPALIVGGVVNFHGNRHFAFRAASGSLHRQVVLYVATEAIALALNGVLFDAAIRGLHPGHVGVLVVRLATQNLVFLGFSFPLWRKVFRPAIAE